MTIIYSVVLRTRALNDVEPLQAGVTLPVAALLTHTTRSLTPPSPSPSTSPPRRRSSSPSPSTALLLAIVPSTLLVLPPLPRRRPRASNPRARRRLQP